MQAALYRGAAAATLAALDRGDAADARGWLLLREFRTATRYTRPGADATLALRDLQAGRTGRDRARLAVVKDLLDSTQAEARERLDEIGRLGERGFAARRAELAAQVAGAWPLLAPRYRRSAARPPSARRHGRRRACAPPRWRTTTPRSSRPAATVRERLTGFTAAPFTPEEQARRANQLAKFVSLIPVEYGHGVEGTAGHGRRSRSRRASRSRPPPRRRSRTCRAR